MAEVGVLVVSQFWQRPMMGASHPPSPALFTVALHRQIREKFSDKVDVSL